MPHREEGQLYGSLEIVRGNHEGVFSEGGKHESGGGKRMMFSWVLNL